MPLPFDRLRRIVLSSVVVLMAVPAQAVSVTNKDDKDHKLTIVEGDNKQDLLLKPNGVLDAVCPKGCVLQLGDGEDDKYVLEGTETVTIEDDKLYDDSPDGRTETAPGSNARPPPAQTAPPATTPR